MKFTRAIKTLRQEGWQQRSAALASMRFVELIGLDPDEIVSPKAGETMPRWQAYRSAVEHFLAKPEKPARRYRMVSPPPPPTAAGGKLTLIDDRDVVEGAGKK